MSDTPLYDLVAAQHDRPVDPAPDPRTLWQRIGEWLGLAG